MMCIDISGKRRQRSIRHSDDDLRHVFEGVGHRKEQDVHNFARTEMGENSTKGSSGGVSNHEPGLQVQGPPPSKTPALGRVPQFALCSSKRGNRLTDSAVAPTLTP